MFIIEIELATWPDDSGVCAFFPGFAWAHPEETLPAVLPDFANSKCKLICWKPTSFLGWRGIVLLDRIVDIATSTFQQIVKPTSNLLTNNLIVD